MYYVLYGEMMNPLPRMHHRRRRRHLHAVFSSVPW